MNKGKMRQWSIVAALAGFLFGFDTVVISGANQPIRELWQTSEWFHGFFIMSMALWGTVLGAIFGGRPTDAFGRRKVLIFIGVLYSISAIGSGLAWDPYSFSFFRFIGGVGVGVSSVAAPAYIAEISTARIRGRLVALYQFNIVFGILIAYFSNFLLKGVGGNNDWRWMLGVEAIPALIYTLLALRIPESPRWLLSKRNDEAAAAAVLRDAGVEDTAAEIRQIREANARVEKEESRGGLFHKAYRAPILLAFFIAFFNQASGINFILYYAPEILEKAGLAAKESLGNSIALGAVNLLFTYVGLYLIDRMGRKKLMLIGSIGYIISLSLVAWSFYSGAGPAMLLSFLLLFIASHAVGQGAVIWVFISEIFPNKVRGQGQAFGASIHWVFAALITLIATPVISYFGDNPWPIFAIFAGLMVLQLIWVLTRMPETNQRSLEELEGKMVNGQ
jgi:sugar porter (SP) family MFS transporter